MKLLFPFTFALSILLTKSQTSFSEIAKENQYKVADMNTWLDESERYQHGQYVRKASLTGDPKRKLNSFMCYKKAYFDAIKVHYQLKHSHSVSQKCGQLWREENEETKQKFRRRSQIAHNKHESIFPGYKYHPNRISKEKKTKKKSHIKNTKSSNENKASEENDGRTNDNKESPSEEIFTTFNDQEDAEHEQISMEEWNEMFTSMLNDYLS